MKVLLIEDDPSVVEAVSLAFELRWPDVTAISTSQGEKGVELVRAESPDIVILDIDLLDINGFEVLRQIRSFSDVPLIILTVKIDEMDKVKGLELGADDYITKPFSHLEFLGRAKAVLRRTHMPELTGEERPFVSGDLMIDFATRGVSRGGNAIKLTNTEYRLLCYLVKNEGRVLTHLALLRNVWGEDCIDSTSYLKKYIQRLRKKLDDDPSNPKRIINVRGIGYKFKRSS